MLFFVVSNNGTPLLSAATFNGGITRSLSPPTPHPNSGTPAQELIVSDGENTDFAAKRASPEWFACFETFFVKVNRRAGRMCVTTNGRNNTTVTVFPMTPIAHAEAADASGAGAAAGAGASGQGEPGRRDAVGGTGWTGDGGQSEAVAAAAAVDGGVAGGEEMVGMTAAG